MKQYSAADVKNSKRYDFKMPKSALYTRTGDKGLTSLVGGQRVPKYSLRLDAYGSLDEFSAFLGHLAALSECDGEIGRQLCSVQNMLFNLGAYLATMPEHTDNNVTGLHDEDVAEIESWIDDLDSKLPPLRYVILPGGCEAAARAGIARTVCRRAERRILELAAEEYVSPLLLSYINRLSDYLFVLGRYFNQKAGVEEIKWQK